MPEPAAVFDRALIGRLAAFSSPLWKDGSSPQASGSSLHSLVSGCWRTTMALFVEATFHEGPMSGASPLVANNSRTAPAGR